MEGTPGKEKPIGLGGAGAQIATSADPIVVAVVVAEDAAAVAAAAAEDNGYHSPF